MHLFYTPDIDGDNYQLSEEESRHAFKVLRLTEGDEIILTDGKGHWMISQLVQAHHKRCLIRVKHTLENYKPHPYKLHMAVAPTKNINRFEWFLEKSTEVGINEITPMRSEHSERKEIKHQRLNKVITSAMKQSLKAWHPTLGEMTSFKQIINTHFEGKKLIAYCEANPEDRIETVVNKGDEVMILIGPEGGFSPGEISQANEKGFVSVSISQSRLRTETAALVACTSMAFINKS